MIYLGVDKCEEPSVKFKKSKHVATAAVSNEDLSLERMLLPTLFDIDLSVRKVGSYRVLTFSAYSLPTVNEFCENNLYTSLFYFSYA